MNWIRWTLAALLATLMGCDAGSGNAGEIEPAMACLVDVLAQDYGQSCANNDDCVAVFEGPVSDACRCVNAGIAAEDLEAYEAALGPDSCYDPENCLAECMGQLGDRGACVQEECAVGLPFLCGDEPCNGANESCVFFGSDIQGEPGGFNCVALPPVCEGSSDCACFRGSQQPFNVEFCLDEGSCDYTGRYFEISCPGG